MNGSVNKVILIGNLGRDPEVRKLENGATLASFSIATSESYTDKQSGKKIENTEWHDVVVWRGLAEVAEKFLKKGTKIYVEGRLKKRSWQDREGNTRYSVEIIGDENQIFKKIFKKINFKIIKLDRVMIGQLTKKDLPRGKWRSLKNDEARNLKSFLN